MVVNDLSVFQISMDTIRMENICMELPDIQNMNRFIGIDFAGASAISHAFLSLS
jgi:hypothetical protein